MTLANFTTTAPQIPWEPKGPNEYNSLVSIPTEKPTLGSTKPTIPDPLTTKNNQQTIYPKLFNPWLANATRNPDPWNICSWVPSISPRISPFSSLPPPIIKCAAPQASNRHHLSVLNNQTWIPISALGARSFVACTHCIPSVRAPDVPQPLGNLRWPAERLPHPVVHISYAPALIL